MMRAGSSYKWIVLAVLVLGTAMLNYSNMVFASRPVDVMAQYGIGQAQLTAISSIGVLPGALFSVALGNVFDRRGPRAIRFLGSALIALAACCQLWRVFADSYVQLFVITFLSGAFFLPTQVLPAKLIEAWFPREQMGTAMGVFGASAGMGIMLAFAAGSLFPTTTSALLSSAAGFGATAIVWALFGKMPDGSSRFATSKGETAGGGALPPSASESGEKTDAGVLVVARSRSMWLLMACSMLAAGAPLLLNSYMVNAFLAKGMTPVETSALGIVFNVSLVVGAVLAGLIVSKLGRYNPPYLALCLLGGVFLLATYLVPAGSATFVLLSLAGLTGAASLSVNMARVGLLPLTGDFSPESIGIAGGMNNTAMGVGMFAIPTVAAFALGQNYGGVFVTLLAFFVVMAVLGGLAIPELGEKGALASAARERGRK